MIAEIMIRKFLIGDELTSGQRLDTNSQWLSERLGELGVRVMYHTTVADDLEANISVFKTAVAGPTWLLPAAAWDPRPTI